MDDMERTSSHPPFKQAARMGRLTKPGSVILWVDRGLWGEVPPALRSVRVAYDDSEIHLFCNFTPDMSDDDRESMQVVGSSIAADFPDHQVFEHCIAPDPTTAVPSDEAAHTVFLRKERWS